LIGLAKGGLGGTIGALATPLMALVMPADQVIGLILPILMLADIFAVALHWRRWNGRLVWLLIPGSVLGVTIGTYFITNAPTRALQIALGVIILISPFIKLRTIMRPSCKHDCCGWLRDDHPPPRRPIAGQHLPAAQGRRRVFIATSASPDLNWIKVYCSRAGLFFHFMQRLALPFRRGRCKPLAETRRPTGR
jgi:uncharacterized membrane protein YfcA